MANRDLHHHLGHDRGAALFTVAGVAAAFGLASCCALPILLTTLGLGTAWLGSVATMAAPHRIVLTGVGALSLLGGRRFAMAPATGGDDVRSYGGMHAGVRPSGDPRRPHPWRGVAVGRIYLCLSAKPSSSLS